MAGHMIEHRAENLHDLVDEGGVTTLLTQHAGHAPEGEQSSALEVGSDHALLPHPLQGSGQERKSSINIHPTEKFKVQIQRVTNPDLVGAILPVARSTSSFSTSSSPSSAAIHTLSASPSYPTRTRASATVTF